MLVLTKVHTAQDPRTHIQCQIASTASAGTARQRAGVGTGDADVELGLLASLTRGSR